MISVQHIFRPLNIGPNSITHFVVSSSYHGTVVLRARVFHCEAADPPRLHIAARASIKSTAPQTILPGESDGIIFQLAGNYKSCMGT